MDFSYGSTYRSGQIHTLIVSTNFPLESHQTWLEADNDKRGIPRFSPVKSRLISSTSLKYRRTSA